MKVKISERNVIFYCPGCKSPHAVNDQWAYNGSITKPTITPSILYRRLNKYRCHSFITDGMIQFLVDCTHKLAGQTVELPDIPFYMLDKQLQN